MFRNKKVEKNTWKIPTLGKKYVLSCKKQINGDLSDIKEEEPII